MFFSPHVPDFTVWIQSKVKSGRWLHHVAVFRIECLLLSRSRSGVGVGVGVDIFRPESESEPESLTIRRLRSSASDDPMPCTLAIIHELKYL